MAASTEYINSSDWSTLKTKLTQLDDILDDLHTKVTDARNLRYSDVDVEAERSAQRILPDEVYVPLHIIDTNIRREQSPYVQYITQSPRAVILSDLEDSTINLETLEVDLTKKIRYQGWQLPMFANIDGFQSMGYGIMEIVQDQTTPGEVACEYVQYGDFAFISDTRDIQAVEMTARAYYYTRTKLVNLVKTQEWSEEEVNKIIEPEPDNPSAEDTGYRDKSLYKVIKFMFRVNGVVHAAWGRPDKCGNWLRSPRPLFIGRRQIRELGILDKLKQMANLLPPDEAYPMAYETNFPYVLFPYLISENDTISQLKGRVFLDQDLQEAASSLLSSIVTKARRSSGLYFSKDINDPNDDLVMQKNIFLRQGMLVNSKINSFELSAPDAGLFSAVNLLITANQSETSQVSFATNNRKDSRKTAKEIEVAEKQEATLSTVQVVLFSIALSQLYRIMVEIIRSRVLAGLVTSVNDELKALYARKYTVKPSGDVDVIEKQQQIQKMMNTWPVVQNTPFATVFLFDLLQLMFPDKVNKYKAVFDQAQQQANSQQAQLINSIMAMTKQMADGIINLSKNPDMFSDVGRIHALPIVEQTAQKLEEMEKMLNGKQ